MILALFSPNHDCAAEAHASILLDSMSKTTNQVNGRIAEMDTNNGTENLDRCRSKDLPKAHVKLTMSLSFLHPIPDFVYESCFDADLRCRNYAGHTHLLIQLDLAFFVLSKISLTRQTKMQVLCPSPLGRCIPSGVQLAFRAAFKGGNASTSL